MNHQITMDHLTQLKLDGMLQAYQGVLAMPVQNQPSINQFMARLAEAELQSRATKKNKALPTSKQTPLQCHPGTGVLQLRT